MKGSGGRASRGKECKGQDITAPSEQAHSTTYIEVSSSCDATTTSRAACAEAEKKGSKPMEAETLTKQEREATTKGYRYRDFSRVQASDPMSIASIFKKGPKEDDPFPVKLHTMLSNPDLEAVITWLPHGRAWRILRPEVFEERILPRYFSHGRLSSFMRQVNGWGFIRVKEGPDYNSYYHELFLRGLPHLVTRMRRQPASFKAKGSLDGEPGFVPDFYKISEQNPLPGCSLTPSQQGDTGGFESFGPANDTSSAIDLAYQSSRETIGPGNIQNQSYTGMTLMDRHASNVAPRGPVHNTQYNQNILQPHGQSFHRLDVPSSVLASSNYSTLDLTQFLVRSDQPLDRNQINTTNATVGVESSRVPRARHSAMLLPPSDSTFDPRNNHPPFPLENQISLLPADNLAPQSADYLPHVMTNPSDATTQSSLHPFPPQSSPQEKSTDREENEGNS